MVEEEENFLDEKDEVDTLFEDDSGVRAPADDLLDAMKNYIQDYSKQLGEKMPTRCVFCLRRNNTLCSAFALTRKTNIHGNDNNNVRYGERSVKR